MKHFDTAMLSLSLVFIYGGLIIEFVKGTNTLSHQLCIAGGLIIFVYFIKILRLKI